MNSISYIEFDNKLSTFRDINEKVHDLIIVDKIHYSKYVEFKKTLGEHYQLKQKLSKLTKGHQIERSINTIRDRIENLEKVIFEFVQKTKNPYAYLLSPYYLYKQGVKYANVPKVSTNTGYIKAKGTGIDALELAVAYSHFKLGIKKPKPEEKVINRNLDLFDDYGDNIYF